MKDVSLYLNMQFCIMNRHVLAALFFVGFLLFSVALMLAQHSGVANASLTAGFIPPLENTVHCICLLSIGALSAWLAGEMIVLLPICGLLMLMLGGLSDVDLAYFPQLRAFTVGAILLFALAMSMMRRKPAVLFVVPVAAWAYFTGNNYMAQLPDGVQPLYFMLGATVSAALLIAIGEALAVTFSEVFASAFTKLKTISALVSLLFFF